MKAYLYINSNGKKTRLELREKSYFIGLNEDIPLEDPLAERAHMRLLKKEQDWCIEFRGKNVVYNGEAAKLNDKIILNDGDWIEIGNTKIIYHTKDISDVSDKKGEAILQSIKNNTDTFVLNQEINFIGRSESNNIEIRKEGISDRHALIFEKEEDFYLLDLASRLGTFVNEQKVSAPVLLKNGDLIAFDRQKYRFQCTTSSNRSISQEQDQARDIDMEKTSLGQLNIANSAHLLILSSPEPGRKIPLDNTKPTLIARKKIEPNAIVIDHPSISRKQHCLLHFDGQNWIVEDLDSTNGIMIENKKEKRIILNRTTDFHIGDVLVRLQLSESSPAIADDSTMLGNTENTDFYNQKTIL